ncbi:MAG: phytanoyl-CoA dioxygenase family protein [Sphingomonas sp.]|nr:phytanoyl-CoA dioxygenase family protein [Sphingomonas sp.]
MAPTSHTSAYAAQIERDGYCIIEDALAPTVIEGLSADLEPQFARAGLSQGAFSGNDTRRFGRLLRRSPLAGALVEHELILEIVNGILGPWCDHVTLNLTQGIELVPGSLAQVPHRDQDMWPCSQLIPAERGVELLVNVMWPLTAFTADNGATQIWPGSNRRQAELLIDPAEAVTAQMMPGSALMFLGSTLHAGGANRTRLPRRGVIVSYCLGWLKPYELPWLAYPPEVARTFPPSLARLAGYRVHRPNLGVYEGRCPSLLLCEESDEIGAVDALLPHQEDLIAAWRSGTVSAADFQAAAGAG